MSCRTHTETTKQPHKWEYSINFNTAILLGAGHIYFKQLPEKGPGKIGNSQDSSLASSYLQCSTDQSGALMLSINCSPLSGCPP